MWNKWSSSLMCIWWNSPFTSLLHFPPTTGQYIFQTHAWRSLICCTFTKFTALNAITLSETSFILCRSVHILDTESQDNTCTSHEVLILKKNCKEKLKRSAWSSLVFCHLTNLTTQNAITLSSSEASFIFSLSPVVSLIFQTDYRLFMPFSAFSY